jgi:hypothetical protein
MGRHRRKVALAARSTVVKAAAAMGVATALAAGINSAANGPTHAQAAADPSGEPVHLAGSSLPESGGPTASQSQQQSAPTGFATQSAGTPKLIQQVASTAAAHTVDALAHTAPAAAPSPSASQPASPSQPAQPSDPSGGSTAPGSAPTSPQTPPPSQGTGGSGHHQGGGLLGGVVGTVGGVVDGLLG